MNRLKELSANHIFVGYWRYCDTNDECFQVETPENWAHNDADLRNILIDEFSAAACNQFDDIDGDDIFILLKGRILRTKIDEMRDIQPSSMKLMPTSLTYACKD